jgi:pyrroloquinoline quinone (PQQ) biosynthesis protein C
MGRHEIHAVVTEVLRHRRLLNHPFYRRWEAGTLALDELADYAGQYRHFEAVLPDALEQITERIEEPTARGLVQANLDDERAVPVPHLDLFDDFARSVGAELDAPAAPATAALVVMYRRVAERAPVEAMAALAAYEVQAPEIAASKAQGLRVRYGLDEAGTRFWDVHAGIDEHHGDWILDALAATGADAAVVRRSATDAAEAWWAFLDEREERGAVVSAC